MYSALRVLKFSMQNFWRNLWLSMATVLVLILATCSINFMMVFNYMAETAIMQVKERVDMGIYFKRGVTDSEIVNVQRLLQKLPYVVDVRHVSSDEALDSFRERHKNTAGIIDSLDELDENPLSASLVVKSASLEDYQSLLTILSDPVYQKIIASTNFEDYNTLISRIREAASRVRIIVLIMVGVFVLMAALIVYNTVRVNVYTHRDEIRVMKLVGATNAFVRAPFILESVFVGLLALLLSSALIIWLLHLIQPIIGVSFGAMYNPFSYFQNNALYLFGAQAIGVVFLNILSSGLSTGRYVRV